MQRPSADLVCVSHLWWDWVWQRPQHLLARLARSYPTLYVEEPRIEIGPPFEGLEVVEGAPNLQVARLVYRSGHELFWERLRASVERSIGRPFDLSPDTSEASLMFDSPEQSRLEEEAREFVAGWRRGGPLVLWLYSPAAVAFIDVLRPDLVVYDAMDDLASFEYAPPRLVEQERELMRRADLVFAGGPSLYEGRKSRHPDAHLFPSGVDAAHFARALSPDLPIPADAPPPGTPCIGFYGVIDERLDLELLRRVAELRPDWNLAMIGPVLKIEESRLPRLPNIRYLGKRGYEDLPAYLKRFDVAMMPFAINEATRSISPTKTLEYLAAHKPVVSTPVKDVVSLYGSVVRTADSPEAFVGQVEAALAETPEERAEREARGDGLVAQHSWDGIAEGMRALIDDRLARKLAARASGEGR